MSQALIDAAAENKLETVIELLNQGADVSYIGKYDIEPIQLGYKSTALVTPLSIAVHNRNTEIARLLLERGAKIAPNVQKQDKPINLCENATNASSVALISEFNTTMLDVYYKLFAHLSLQSTVVHQPLFQYVLDKNKDILKILALHFMSIPSQMSVLFCLSEAKLTTEDMESYLAHHDLTEEIAAHLKSSIDHIKFNSKISATTAEEMVSLINEKIKNRVGKLATKVSLATIIEHLSTFNNLNYRPDLIQSLQEMSSLGLKESANSEFSDKAKAYMYLFRSKLSDEDRKKFNQKIKPEIKSFIASQGANVNEDQVDESNSLLGISLGR